MAYLSKKEPQPPMNIGTYVLVLAVNAIKGEETSIIQSRVVLNQSLHEDCLRFLVLASKHMLST